MQTVTITCAYCGNQKDIPLAEYNRQIKKQPDRKFFCSRSCVAKYCNAPRKSAVIQKVCPVCKKSFETTANRYESTFCSRSCASKGSVTEYRRQKAIATGQALCKKYPGDVDKIKKVLENRENWKYQEIQKYLTELGVKHEFEYVLGNYIYDLALTDVKILYEFDGKEHNLKYNREKDKLAVQQGWKLYRVPIKSNTIISPDLLNFHHL